MNTDFFMEINGAIIASTTDGIVVYQNDKSKAADGNMIGKNMRRCHKPESLAKIDAMINNNASREYTIEKNGVKEFICQTPWYDTI